MAVSFRYRLLDEFLQEWKLRKKQLASGEINKKECQEWKLNLPQTTAASMNCIRNGEKNSIKLVSKGTCSLKKWLKIKFFEVPASLKFDNY